MSDFTAMLIEASHESAALIKRLLEKNQIQVIEWAVTGVGWITPFQSRKPDILVVDYMLPQRDGLYCIEKAMELNPGLKVIFTHCHVGHAANEIETRAFALGVVGVAQKPINESRFNALTARLLSAAEVDRQQKKRTLVLGARKTS